MTPISSQDAAPLAPQVGGLDPLAPTENTRALLAYYLGFLALLPGVGLLFGIGAVVLGVQAASLAQRYPHLEGRKQAQIGMIVGGAAALLNLLAIGFVLVSSARYH